MFNYRSIMNMFTDYDLFALSQMRVGNNIANARTVNLAIAQGLFKPKGRSIEITEDGMYFFDNYLADYIKDLELEYGNV